MNMVLTLFLSLVFCVAITIMMFAAVAFIQDSRLFSSAPKEARAAIIPRDKEIFQFYFPELETVYSGRKYGFNIKSQLIKLFVVFPAASAIAAWICSRI